MDRRQFLRAASCAGFASLAIHTKASSFEVSGEAQNGIIWRADSKKGNVFLTPTVHKLPRHLKVPHQISIALQQSDVIFIEANTDDKALPEDKSSLIYVDTNDSVFENLSPATTQLLKLKLATINIPIEKIIRLKPWVISSILEERELADSGFESLTSVEQLFKEIEKGSGKKVIYLETISQQLRLFDSLPDHIQDAMLQNYLLQKMSSKDTQKVVIRIAQAWEQGNITCVQTQMKKIDVIPANVEETVNRVMLANRNLAFFKQVNEHFDLIPTNFATLAVGFNYYLGDQGLLRLFQDSGYKITSLRISK
ncbi:TraB/GumN family protein [Pseudomonas sp. CBMAI 2609]|uniref:TraB/GumN family protein n=1 Tax=Pseudomonas flavocrustae TaxID=2991719 RepID=A0ABT6II64_9PSED|nr:TraB/GumN family protein [Pseudomonas sp. CBMAI 2609]MDH4764136.1 TraB/GumN family protein [Pseudomonas sp. CBMAI 2609]